MKLVEHVPGGILVLEVASRSRPGLTKHYLTRTYDEEGDVSEVGCNCEGFSSRGRCHHPDDALDLSGGLR